MGNGLNFEELKAACAARTKENPRFPGILIKYRDADGRISGSHGERRLVFLLSTSETVDIHTGEVNQRYFAFDPNAKDKKNPKDKGRVRQFFTARTLNFAWEGKEYGLQDGTKFLYPNFSATAGPIQLVNGQPVGSFSRRNGEAYEDYPIALQDLNGDAWEDLPVHVIEQINQPFSS